MKRAAELRAAGRELVKKATDNPDSFTTDDANLATETARELAEIESRIERVDSFSKTFAQVLANSPHTSSEDPNGDTASRHFVETRKAASGGGSGRASRAAAFAGTIRKAMDDAAPVIGGPSVRKGLVPQGAVAFDFNGRPVSDPKAELNILSAINTRPVDVPAWSYLRQTERTNNAATVPRDGVKPRSSYALKPVNVHLATVAHLSEPIAIQHLADYEALDMWLNEEMTYGINAALANFVLQGGFDENGDAVQGIMNTAGVIQTPAQATALRSIRRGLGQLSSQGTPATGIILNPTDWEEMELAADTTGRFLLGADQPTTSVAKTLWGVPVTLTNDLPAGQAIVGELSTVTLRFREHAQMAWNPYASVTGPADSPVIAGLFRRNQIEARVEARVGLEITQPKALRIVDLIA